VEDDNMNPSLIAKEQQTLLLKNGIPSIYAEVFARAFAEGYAEECVLVGRDTLLRLLRAHFPGPLPADLCDAVQANTDPDDLSHWFELALAAPSLDSFRVAIRPRPGAPAP
jgi:hypothetical protein